jgi:hypothetical protein
VWEHIVILEEIYLEIFKDLYICTNPEHEKVVSGMPHLSVCMCASLPPERIDELYSHSVFTGLSTINLYPVSTAILTPKIGAGKQNCDFLENG